MHTHLHKAWSELVLIFQIDVCKVALLDRFRDWEEFALKFGNDWEQPWHSLVDKVSIVLAIIERVHCHYKYKTHCFSKSAAKIRLIASNIIVHLHATEHCKVSIQTIALVNVSNPIIIIILLPFPFAETSQGRKIKARIWTNNLKKIIFQYHISFTFSFIKSSFSSRHAYLTPIIIILNHPILCFFVHVAIFFFLLDCSSSTKKYPDTIKYF